MGRYREILAEYYGGVGKTHYSIFFSNDISDIISLADMVFKDKNKIRPLSNNTNVYLIIED